MGYTKKDWGNFLEEAKERISTLNETDDKKAERKARCEHSCEDCKKPPTAYDCHECDIIESIKNFAEEKPDGDLNKELKTAYKSYENGKSIKFFETNIKCLQENKLKLLKRCKILIVTANPIEKATLHSLMAERNPKRKILRFICDTNVYYVFKWGKYWVAHVHQHQTGANKDFGAVNTVFETLKYVHPNVILSLGVAFGIDYKKQKIGDVLVSKYIFPYSENKRDREEVKPDRMQDKRIDYWLDVRLANATGFLDENNGVYYGGMLSGGSVVSSATEKDRVCTAYSGSDCIIGGEMEGSGLFQVSYFTGIPCVVIKGICDWGVAKNDIYPTDSDKENKLKDSLQAYAMMQVIEKCEPLFSDKTLFATSKNKVFEREKKKNKLLSIASIVTLICMLTALILFLIPFKNSDVNLWAVYGSLGLGIIVDVTLALLAWFKKRRFAIEDKIEYNRLERETKSS